MYFPASQPPWQPVDKKGPRSGPGTVPTHRRLGSLAVVGIASGWVPGFEGGGCLPALMPRPAPCPQNWRLSGTTGCCRHPKGSRNRGALGPPPQKWPLELRAESAQAGRSWAAAGVPGWSCTWCRCRCWLRKVPLEATQVLSRGAASMYCCVMMQAGVQPPGAGVCGGLWRTARPAGLCPQVQLLQVHFLVLLASPLCQIHHGLLVL